MNPNELSSYLKSLPHLADKGKSARVQRARSDFAFAVTTYFSHHITKEETSEFRKYAYSHIDEILACKKNTVEAYRGAAKTTVFGRLLYLWLSAVKGEKRNTVTIGATLPLAKKTLEFIKDELEDNDLLIADFEIKKSEKWTEDEIVFFVGANKFRLKAYGAGTKIRGENWIGFRPDLIVCDDIENDENVISKAQRDKLESWFKKAILKLPQRGGAYNIIFIGTKIHHDSLLSRLQQSDDFNSLRFPLVLQFPSNLDELNPKTVSYEELEDFVLDDSSLDKAEIIREYFDDKDSFMSEYQNEPLSKDGTTFGDYETYEIEPQVQSITIGVDPALGKAKGDYFAITILKYDGKRFYATVKMYKIKATLMIDKIMQLYLTLMKHGVPMKIAIETVQFQEFFKDTLDEKCKAIGLHLPIVPLKNTVNKELRIDSISPLVNNHTILIDKKSLIFIDELDTYPKSPHDDGLDSLEMAYRIAKKPAFDYKQALKHQNSANVKNKALERLMSG
ncbi:MAG: phage terminase large subunit [Sulfurospirillum sp.]|nr:phage terminase large subunit [Sulfurospirillum sp.]